MKQLTYILAMLCLAGCGGNNNSQSEAAQALSSITTNSKEQSEWIFDSVQNSRLTFKNGQVCETGLFELKFIGLVSAGNKAPYLIFSGRDCNECDANIAIYIHSPDDGKLVIDNGQNRYPYPGTVKDYETDSVLYVSRAFYGQVLENINGVIWYGSRFVENGAMERFVFLSYLQNGSLKDTTYEATEQLDFTLALKNKALCNEIEGREFTSEP